MKLDPLTALRLAATVRAAALKYRKHQVEALIREMGDKDQLGIGRVIALQAMQAVEG